MDFEDKYKQLLRHSLSLAKWLIIAYIGGTVGVSVTWVIIAGFAMMIMAQICNFYFAFLFFVVGSVYTYRLFGKKRIQFANDNDFADTIETKRLNTGAHYDVFGHPFPQRGHAPRERDRFLLGGREEQPDGFIKPEPSSNLENLPATT